MKNSMCLLSVLLCLCTVSFSSCENKKQVNNANQDSAESRAIPVIKIEPPDESDLKPLLLSEFADSISYVKMDTDPSYFISGKMVLKTPEGYLFRTEMLHFSKEGKFLCKVGKIGRGPGEYLNDASAAGVDPKNKIVYVRGYGMIHSLLKYSLIDGKYMGTLKKDFAVGGMSMKGMNDALVMVYPALDKNKPNIEVKQDIILYNTTLDSVMDSRSFDYHITAGEYGHHDITNNILLTSYHDKIYYKNAYIDTLYSITKERITPCMIIDMGKHAFPVDYIYGVGPFENVIRINKFFIAGDRLFLHCIYYSSFSIYSVDTRLSFVYICDLDGQNGSYYEPMFVNDLDNGPNYVIPTRGDVSIIDVGDVDGERKDIYLPNNKMEKKMKDKDRFKRLYEASNPVEDNPIVRTIHWKE